MRALQPAIPDQNYEQLLPLKVARRKQAHWRKARHSQSNPDLTQQLLPLS